MYDNKFVRASGLMAAGLVTVAFSACRVTLFASPFAQGQPANLERTLNTIQESIETGNLDGALLSIAKALDGHPNEAGLFNLRGIVYARQQQFTAARADFERAVHLDSRLTPAWQNLARACQLLANTDNSSISCAIDGWSHVLRQRPNDVEARTSLATLDLWRGSFTESLQQLRALPQAESTRASVLALRCADLAGLNRFGEANEVATRLARAPDFTDDDAATVFPVLKSPKTAMLAATLVEALDARNAASVASLRQLAVAYEQLNRPADARKVLERVAILEPRNPRHLMELARLAYILRDRESALGYLGHARDLTPNDAQVHFLFGMIALDMDLPVEARRSLDRALALDPKNAKYNYAMGTVTLRSHDVSSAIPRFEIYLAAEPQDPRGHFALGVAYFAAGDYERARKEMEGIRSNANIAPGAEYFLGRIARLDEKLEEAAEHIEKSIHLSPSFAESYTELGRIRLRQGQTNEARTALDRALALDANSFQANATLLGLYQRTHDPRAEEQAERVRKLDADRSARQELMLRTIELRPY